MLSSRKQDTETVEIESDVPSHPAPSRPPLVRVPGNKAQDSPRRSFSYRPESGLLDKVTVTDWPTDYSYYEQFRAAAMKLRDYTADACPAVPFFSYVPQYSQMTQDQLSYYLYLRTEICEGRYPEADYGYLLLLLYETINLSDINSTAYSLSVFCNVFLGYREAHERLSMQVADWMCDFCLIHRCIPPRDLAEPLLGELAQASGFPEFYIGLYRETIDPVSVIRYSSQYDYTQSRFARGENAALYEKTMNGVLSALMTDEKLASDFENAMSERYTLTRDAYVGALCSPQIKKRMQITFRSMAKSHGIRFLVSDILRYTENKLRACLGVKSRISVGKLPPEIRGAADAYLEKALCIRPKTPKEEIPEYEKLYEPAPSLLTAEAAAEIERASWDTTEKLAEAFTESIPEEMTAFAEILPPEEKAAPEENDSAEMPQSLFAVLTPQERAFVAAAIREDAAAQKKAAAADGRPCALLADSINEKASEITGDIVLEENGSVYRILGEYLAEIEKEFMQ